jgi:hypothetical protein
LIELQPALQAASSVKLELQAKAVVSEREGLPHDGSALLQLQADVDEMTRSKDKIEGQCRSVVEGAQKLLLKALQCGGQGEQGGKIEQRLAELRELRAKFPWLAA